jgi:hypothetical protein
MFLLVPDSKAHIYSHGGRLIHIISPLAPPFLFFLSVLLFSLADRSFPS